MCRKRQKGGNFARPEQFIDRKNDPGPILNTNKARSHWECSVTHELASSPSHSYYKLTASLPLPTLLASRQREETLPDFPPFISMESHSG